MINVLIVDDSRTSRRVLRDILERAGYEIAGEAVNGKEAIEMYERLHPDIVTMDITMPEMDGIECFKAIRSQVGGMNRNTHVVILTANADEEHKILFEKEGLSVPTTYKELVDVCNAFREKGYDNPMMGFSKEETTSIFSLTAYPFFCETVANDAEAVKKLFFLRGE